MFGSEDAVIGDGEAGGHLDATFPPCRIIITGVRGAGSWVSGGKPTEPAGGAGRVVAAGVAAATVPVMVWVGVAVAGRWVAVAVIVTVPVTVVVTVRAAVAVRVGVRVIPGVLVETRVAVAGSAKTMVVGEGTCVGGSGVAAGDDGVAAAFVVVPVSLFAVPFS